jgi:diadenosine tetraphosphatase ApaH/serine/threonine PP2A family protein phosphatase
MLIALFSDIQANREAFEACLADAGRHGAERHVFLGDLVGYGADPEWAVERTAQMVADGALVVRGNHDAAAIGGIDSMNPVAQAAIDWTRARLSAAHRAFLGSLPLTAAEDDRLYVHASGCAPEDWIYVLGPREAYQSFRATRQRITFCGHTHIPALFHESAATPPQRHVPADGVPIPLLPQRRWVAVLGAVGQPRDDNPDACYGLFDVTSSRLTYMRVPYDVDLAARKIRAAGLPDALAARLAVGH